MIDMLKPAREIVAELNRMESKWTSILIHGVGKIQNVDYHKEYYQASDDYTEFWKFNIKLDDGIVIKCQTYSRYKKSKEFFYFEEGDYIEFFGKVNTRWMGRFCQHDVSDIFIYFAKLSEEERNFTEVFMWNIGTYKSNGGKVAATRNEELGILDSEIAYIGELEEPENKWTYGTLVKTQAGVILEVIKFFE